MFLFACLDFQSFVAYSKVSGIETIHLIDANNPNLPFESVENATSMRNVIGIAIDRNNQRYFFTDIQIGNIQSVHFNGTGFRVVVDS